MGKRGPKYKYDLDKEAKELERYAEECDIPMLSEFACKRGYHPEYFSRWAVNHDKINQAVKRCKAEFEYKVAKAMLRGQLNATSGIFCLKNVCKWHDRQELEHIGEQNKSVINIFRSEGNGHTPQAMAGQVHLHRSTVPGNGSRMGNGKVSVPDSAGADALREASE